MKRNITSPLFVITFLVTMVLSMGPSAQAQQCTMAGAAGKYGFTLTGTLLLPTGPVPVGAVGKAIVHADGTLSGTDANSVGGSFANETFTGTFTVNPDCTGVETVKFFQSGALVRTAVISFVFDDNMKEVRFVQQSLTLPDGTNLPSVITAQARRMFPSDQQD